MPNVTLIGEKQAIVGLEFFYLGPISDCRDCKVRTVCFNLESGRLYRIKEVRSSPQHECKIHEGRARAIEFEKVPIRRAAFVEFLEGSPQVYEYDGSGCRQIGCENYGICKPMSIQRGERFRIVNVGSDVNCPEGYRLREIFIE
jgi:uncharacterized protein (UPF0179 family)